MPSQTSRLKGLDDLHPRRADIHPYIAVNPPADTPLNWSSSWEHYRKLNYLWQGGLNWINEVFTHFQLWLTSSTHLSYKEKSEASPFITIPVNKQLIWPLFDLPKSSLSVEEKDSVETLARIRVPSIQAPARLAATTEANSPLSGTLASVAIKGRTIGLALTCEERSLNFDLL